MIVYVESNFLLEIALSQEQALSAEALLALAASGRITLTIPAISLSEPFATVTQRARERRKLHRAIHEQVRDLGRSTLHGGVESTFKPVLDTLLRLERLEMDRLTSTVERLLANASPIELTDSIFQTALAERPRFGLSVQDAIIFASVMADARMRTAEPKCFVSRNFKHFRRSDIIAELFSVNCRYAASFDDGLSIANAWAQTGG